MRTVAAIIAGGVYAGLLASADPIAEYRSARRVGLARRVVAGVVLCSGAVVFGLTVPLGWHWEACRTYVFVATVMALVARYGGQLVAATVFAGYVGACLFVGVPISGNTRWWAVPVQAAEGPSIGMSLLVVAAFVVVQLVFRSPVLPPDHRGAHARRQVTVR